MSIRGRKPRLPSNVTPLRAVAGESAEDVARRKAVEAEALARDLKPARLDANALASEEWDFVAPILAEKGRLEKAFVRTLEQYCYLTARLVEYRNRMPTPDDEVYESETRNGFQLKSHPWVAQYNETLRQWRAYVALFGLSPADEVRLDNPGQLDMFDDPVAKLREQIAGTRFQPIGDGGGRSEAETHGGAR